MPPARRIVVVGSSNTDLIMKLPQLPAAGVTVLGGVFTKAAGGKGANQAVAAARLGGNVAFVGCVGTDPFGEEALAGLAREQIDLTHVARDGRRASGVALIFVGPNGDNSIGVASGANAALTTEHIEAARPLLRQAGVVLLQLETPLPVVEAAAREAAESGATVILNPAPACALPATLLGLIDVLTPNEHEATQLSGVPVLDLASARVAADRLIAMGPHTVVITLGAQGALVCTRNTAKHVPALPVSAVDATAAGDTFNGALAVALSEGRPLVDAVRFANLAAAISVTRLGAQPSIPTRAEVEQRLTS